MKFRTDFVTNSSSSSFVAVRLTARDGQASSYVIDDLELHYHWDDLWPLEDSLYRKDGELFYQDKPLRTSADLVGALLHLIFSGELKQSPYLLESLCAVAAFEQNTLEPQALLEVLARDPAFSSLAGTEPTREAVEQALGQVDNLLCRCYLGLIPKLTDLCADAVPTLDELSTVTINTGEENWGEFDEFEEEFDDVAYLEARQGGEQIPGDEFCSFDL